MAQNTAGSGCKKTCESESVNDVSGRAHPRDPYVHILVFGGPYYGFTTSSFEAGRTSGAADAGALAGAVAGAA
jgi:hypothetical protein